MRLRTAWLPLAVLCVGLVMGACGDDDSSDDLSAESRAAIAGIDEICGRWKTEQEALGKFPLDDFDPENPKATELRVVGDFFASTQPVAAKAMTDLRGVSVPAEIKARTDTLLAELDAEISTQKIQTAAAQAGDIGAFKATLKDAASGHERVEDAAKELGTKKCSF